MKSVKNFVFAVLLASVLAVSAPAGEVDGPGFAGPSPTPTPQRVVSTSDEETSDPNVPTVEISDYLFFEALAALLSVY
jgi:hypothetical protein